jgi:hypothetical protein
MNTIEYKYRIKFTIVEGELNVDEFAIDPQHMDNPCKYLGGERFMNLMSRDVINLPEWRTRFSFKRVIPFVMDGEDIIGVVSEKAAENIDPKLTWSNDDLIYSMRDDDGDEYDQCLMNEIDLNNASSNDRILVRCPWGCFH